MKMVSIKRPRPSIEIAIPAASSFPVNAALVNSAPWSVLNIFGCRRLLQGLGAECAVHRVRQTRDEAGPRTEAVSS
jgi:hypothetical protein